MMLDPAAQPDADGQSATLLAIVASLSLEAAHVSLDAIEAESGALPDPIGPDGVASLLADLTGSGWLTEWETPERGPGVILTAWAADRLGLRLNSDSERWVSARDYQERPEVCGNDTGTIVEADLGGITPLPLDEHTDEGVRERVRRRDPGDGYAPASEREDAAMVRYLAGQGGRGPRGFSPADFDLIVLLGPANWPLPGQHRPDGPISEPSEWEAERGKGKKHQGVCSLCGGRKLRANEYCAAPGCERAGFDQRISAAIKREVAASIAASKSRGPGAEPIPIADGQPGKRGRKAGKPRGKAYRPEGGLRGGIGA